MTNLIDSAAALACAEHACRNMDGELDFAAMTDHFRRHRERGEESANRPQLTMHSDFADIVALLERALEDARSGRLKALALGGMGADEHVTAYTFDDDQAGLRELLARAMLLVSQQIASGIHEQVPA